MTESARPSEQIPDHALLRVIGRGSYGEVWLARNVMDTLRAVKIVSRTAFDNDRPWLREFEGIRRCEPVSRAHDGLVDILHMGRNEEKGFFYYVMELADNEAGDSEDYAPATLASRLAGGKALAVPECLRLAESLAGTLAFLHENGLIHRDVKPPNVLYFGGVPKLGDIGLVAETGSSRSFVGTEGYVPLEGPGSERADLFALGKVLYEALTGMDRGNFPSLPSGWAQDPDFLQRLELNEIVLRACEGNPDRCYRSAREMLAEIALVASGRSVKRLRGIERRMRRLRWGVLGAVGVAAVALGVSAVWKGQANREKALRVRAEQAEDREREERFTAMLAHVHAARHDTSHGAVVRALEVARRAAGIRVTPELRDDTVFLLGRSDFVARPDLAITFTQPIRAFDADSLQMAEMPIREGKHPSPLTITLRTAGKPDSERVIELMIAPADLSQLQFSRGGERLLVSGISGAGLVLDSATGRVLSRLEPGAPPVFCGEKDDAILRRAENGGFAFLSLSDSLTRAPPALEGWPQQGASRRVWPSPDGRFALLIEDTLELPGQSAPPLVGAACLAEIESGRVLWRVPGPDEQVAAWSHDSTRIAVRRGDAIVSLDAATGEIASQVPLRIQNRGTQLAFLDSRDLLVFSTWSMSGLCDLAREEMRGKAPVVGIWSYSRSRDLLVGAGGTVEWHPSPVLRVFRPPVFEQFPVYFSYTPDEKALVVGYGPRFLWWDIDNPGSQPEVTIPAPGASHVLFSPDGRTVRFLDDDGIHEMPWTGHPPEKLPAARPYGPGATQRSDYVSASSDGKTIAYGGLHFAIVCREGEGLQTFRTGDSANPVGLSPDGRFLALGSHHVEGLRVFDLKLSADNPVHVESCGAGNHGVFSPGGTLLAISDMHWNSVLDTSRWATVFRSPRQSGAIMGHPSFSRDAPLLSMPDSTTSCTVRNTGDWSIRARFQSPLDEIFERTALSPKGRYFTAVGTRRELYVWDLKALDSAMQAQGFGEDFPETRNRVP